MQKNIFLKIIEMRVTLPSPPRNLAVEEISLTFSSPEYLGGSNILSYEVSLRLIILNCIQSLNLLGTLEAC